MCPKFTSRSSRAISKSGKENLRILELFSNMAPVLISVVVVGESVSLRSSPASKSGTSSLPVHYLSKPQFLPFFGFSEGGQRHKGVDYRIWHYEVKAPWLRACIQKQ